MDTQQRINNSYKLGAPADKLLDRFIAGGCEKMQDITYSDIYLRHNESLIDVKCFTEAKNNILYDYDYDFDYEPSTPSQKSNIEKAKANGYIDDLKNERRQIILSLPKDLNIANLPNDVLITITQHNLESFLYNQQKRLVTIKFTDNSEMYGEINSGVFDGEYFIEQILAKFLNHAHAKNIGPINNGYQAFCYGTAIEKCNFGL